MNNLFFGVDVQINRGVPVAVMDSHGEVIDSMWFSASDAPNSLIALLGQFNSASCFIGIDAPRMPLPKPRTWTFSQNQWQKCNGKRGRHCELVIKTLGLGNPQWTPLIGDAPEWMLLGFTLFSAADSTGATTYEVFPTSTYRLLKSANHVQKVTIPLTNMKPGPKDMLDSIAAAFTALRFHKGLGCEVGGGDGLGTIVLPSKIENHPINYWQEKDI